MTTAANLLKNLPAADTVRWTPKKKAAVIDAIAGAVIGEGEAMARYNISAAELDGWRGAVTFAGTAALRVTRMQAYPRFA